MRDYLALVSWFSLIWLTIPAIAGEASGGVSGDDFAALYSQVGKLTDAGRYAEAVPLAKQLEALAESQFGDESPQHAIALNSLGNLCLHLNEYALAEPPLRRALSIAQKLL
jgi:hypothetical protein